MKKHIADFRIALLVALIGFGAGAPVELRASNNNLQIAQVPVFLGAQPKPNVMLTFNDNAPMSWAVGPGFVATEGLGSALRLTYLIPYRLGQEIPAFDDNFGWNLRARNAQRNSLFYNPETDYGPWVRADRTLFPDSDPDNAPVDPFLTDPQAGFAQAPPFTTVDLDSLNSWDEWIDDINNPVVIETRQFWPITFYVYHGGDPDSPASYTKYQIQENQGFRASPADAQLVPINQFNWPNGVTRSVAEEKQNFANWFTYHRTRHQAAKHAIGRVLAAVGDGFRLGLAIINWKLAGAMNFDVDGEPNKHVLTGVRDFNTAGRDAFYDALYGQPILGFGSYEPRDASVSVGQYFERDDDRGPWSSTPGVSGGDDLACRQSYHILTSDGSDADGPSSPVPAGSSFAGVNPNPPGNADGTAGTTLTGPGGSPSFTYTPQSPFADAYSNTLADVAMHYWKRDLRPDIPNEVPTTPEDPAFWQHLTWFSLSLGGASTVDPVDAFDAITTGAQINWPVPDRDGPESIDDLLHAAVNGRGEYLTTSDFTVFADQLTQLLREIAARAASVGGVSVSATRLTQNTVAYAAEFDSSDWTGELRAINLTTQSTEWEASVDLNARAPGSRTILTYDGSGTGFDTGMSSSLKALIDSDPARADDIIRYVRGEPVAGFRPRTSILGDIVNSKPTLAGPSNEGWASLPAPAGGSTYATFVDDKAQVDDVVYVGGNGGMLHAFDAETGEEVFGYVPRAVLPKLGALTDDPYAHQFYVDGQQTVRDAWDGSQWRRVLVGTLGAGGRGVYALDITNPSSPEVLWEISSDDDLGYVFGKPLITRLGESGPGGGTGNWKAIFGNGYNSTNGDSILYSVDLFTGSATKITVDSGGGGLSAPELVLEPASRLYTSRVYAGDLDGTVWRVDFDDSGTPSVKYPNGLFTTANNRPITSAPGLAASPSGGLLVYVGTGKLLETNDRLSTDFESFYAVRDQGSALGANPALGSVSVSNAGNNVEFVGNPGADGWVLDLTDAGERVVEPPRILFGQLIFSSFEPLNDPCDTGGSQRLYVLDATTGSGELDDICANCGVIDFGSGGPIAPPLVITPPPSPGSGPPPNDPTDPFADPGGNLPGGSTVGAVTGWCATLGATDGTTTTQLGQICDGRQVWRQVR